LLSAGKFTQRYESLKLHPEENKEAMEQCHSINALYLNIALLSIGEDIDTVKQLNERCYKIYENLIKNPDEAISSLVDFILELLARPYCN
jgi:hypothetical protein